MPTLDNPDSSTQVVLSSSVENDDQNWGSAPQQDHKYKILKKKLKREKDDRALQASQIQELQR